MEPDKKKQRKEDKEKKPDTFSSTPKNDAPASHNGLTRTPLPTEPVEQQVIGALNHGQPTPAAGAALALFAKTRAGATLPKASVTGGRAAPGSGAKKEHVASPDEVARNIRLGLTDRGKELGASNTQASQRPQFTSPSTSAYFVKNSFGTFDNPGVFGTPGILHAGQIHAAAGSYDKSTEAGVTTSPYSKTAYGSASDVPHQPGTAKFNPYDPFPPAASAPGGSTVMPAPDPYKVSERPSTFLVRSQPFGSTAAAGGGESQPRPILRHRPQPPRPSGSPGSASHPVNVERSTPRTPPNGIRGRPTKFGKRPREESTESPDTSPVRPHLPANTRTHTQTSTGGPSRPPLPGNIRSHIQASTNDPARVLAQPRNAAPAVDIGPPYTSVLIQYRCSSKKLGPDQLIGIAVISVPRQQVYLSVCTTAFPSGFGDSG